METMVQVQEKKLFVLQRIEALLGALNELPRQTWEQDQRYELKGGTKYLRVAKANYVHFFVDALTGDILKAAGWKAPAKGARYNIATEEGMAEMLRNFDTCGRFLYADYRKV